MMTIDLYKFLYSTLFFMLGNTMVWFQVSFSRAFPAYSDYSFYIAVLLAIPIAICFYFGWNYGYDALDSWWGIRFISFGLTFIIFPILTYYFLGESLFTLKHALCTLLSILIILIQVSIPDVKLYQ